MSTWEAIEAASSPPRAAQLEIGFRRRFRQRLAHELDSCGQPLVDHPGAAIDGVRQIRELCVDNASALAGRIGESGKATVEVLRALLRAFGERGSMAIKCRPDHPGAAIGGVRQIRELCVDNASALVGRIGESGKAAIEVLRALLRAFGQRGSMAIKCRPDRRAVMVERGAERLTVRLEHGADGFSVLAHLLLELRTARVEPLAHFLQRRNDLVLEAVHAGAERARDVFHTAGQRRVDVLRQRRDRLRQFARPLLQRLADLRRLGVHALNELATAFAERARDFERVAGQHLRQRAGALSEAFLDAGEQAFERAGHLVEPGFGALVDRLEVRFDQGRRLLVAAAEPFVDRAAPADQRLLDRAELGGKIVGERIRSIADLAHEVASASVDCAFQPRQTLAERRPDRRAVMVERGAERRTVRLEHGADGFSVLAHLLLELRTARVEPLAHFLQRRNDLVLEAVHAGAERARDVFHTAGQRRVDVLRQRRDRLRQFARPLLQRLADLRRLGVHALNELATAFAERARDFERVAGQRFRQRAGALSEAFLDAGEQAFERAGHLVEPGFGALVDRLEVRFDQGRRLLVAAAEPFVDRAAPADQRLLDRAELGGKIVGERIRSIADLAHEVASASVDCAFEPRQTLPERRLDAAGLRDEGLIDRVVVCGRSGFELPQTLSRLRGQVLEMIAEAPVEIFATGSQDGVQRAEMVGQSSVELVRMNRDAIDDAMAAFADQVVERLQLLAHPPRLVREGLDQSGAALAHDAFERRDLRGQGLVDVGCPGRDLGRSVAGERDEAAADLRRLGVELDERFRRRLLYLRLCGRRLDRHGVGDATRGVID